jgi:penicillin amidase
VYVPGWTDAYEWTGFIPFEDLPSVTNPPEGYIVTANNAVVDGSYPYLITTDWDYGFRAQRIVQLIENAPGKIDAAYIQQIQGDGLTPGMDFLLPQLMQLELPDPAQAQARAILEGWDGQNRMDSPQAALYAAFTKHLLARTFADDLPAELAPEGGSRWYEVLRELVGQPGSPWWDDRTTEAVETMPQTMSSAFADAVADLKAVQGSDPARWKWGDLHTITFKNQTLGKSGIAPIEGLFNRGPFPTAGGEAIVNATGWDASKEGYVVDWLPSMRMIADLSDLNRSLAVNTTGQSGHAYHAHYQDMIDLWRNIQYHPMRFDAQEIQSGAEGHLVLEP